MMDRVAFISAILFSVVGIILGIFVSLWVELIFGFICLALWGLYLRMVD